MTTKAEYHPFQWIKIGLERSRQVPSFSSGVLVKFIPNGGTRHETQIGFLIALCATLSAIPAFSDDQQKAEKQIRKISAMATDVNARSIVSRSMSDMLKVERTSRTRTACHEPELRIPVRRA